MLRPGAERPSRTNIFAASKLKIDATRARDRFADRVNDAVI
jgi:hypothetical protein